MNNKVDKAIADKIRKLFALTTSPNEAEAAVALSKAHEMLKSHNLSIHDISSDNPYNLVAEPFYEGFRERLWHTMLVVEVCRANYCASAKINDGIRYSIKIVGKEHNVAGARVMIDYLLEVLERKSKELPVRDRESYKTGMVAMFQKRFQEMMWQDEEECNALVVSERATVAKQLNDMGFVNKQISVDVKKPSAYDKGYKDAEDVSFNRQMDTQKTSYFGFLNR